MKFKEVFYPIIISPARILELFIVTNTKEGVFSFIMESFINGLDKESRGNLTLTKSQDHITGGNRVWPCYTEPQQIF
jgi:hypothetical protein